MPNQKGKVICPSEVSCFCSDLWRGERLLSHPFQELLYFGNRDNSAGFKSMCCHLANARAGWKPQLEETGADQREGLGLTREWGWPGLGLSCWHSHLLSTQVWWVHGSGGAPTGWGCALPARGHAREGGRQWHIPAGPGHAGLAVFVQALSGPCLAADSRAPSDFRRWVPLGNEACPHVWALLSHSQPLHG